MPGNPKAPDIGELNIDASDCTSYAVDLPPGALQGMRTGHDGVSLVVAEVTANQATYGDRAGVTKGDFDQLTTANDRIQQIDIYLPAARKMVELLTETRAQQVDLRERAVSSIAASVDARSRQPGNKDLLAKYEATRAYRSEAANKGVRTRQRNAEEKANAGNGAPAGGSSTSPATSGNGTTNHP